MVLSCDACIAALGRAEGAGRGLGWKGVLKNNFLFTDFFFWQAVHMTGQGYPLLSLDALDRRPHSHSLSLQSAVYLCV